MSYSFTRFSISFLFSHLSPKRVRDTSVFPWTLHERLIFHSLQGNYQTSLFISVSWEKRSWHRSESRRRVTGIADNRASERRTESWSPRTVDASVPWTASEIIQTMKYAEASVAAGMSMLDDESKDDELEWTGTNKADPDFDITVMQLTNFERPQLEDLCPDLIRIWPIGYCRQIIYLHLATHQVSVKQFKIISFARAKTNRYLMCAGVM